MRRHLFAVMMAASILSASETTVAKEENPGAPVAQTAGDFSGAHDFDFLMGDWRVHHRVNKAGPDAPWVEFESECSERPLMGGRANVEEHRFEKPGGRSYGVALRTYDPATATWAIWWYDSRFPHGDVDPPMKGRFEGGVGRFYSDSTFEGKPVKVRFLWTRETNGHPRWEQAYSQDGGASWAVNWVMDFAPSASR